MCRNSLHYADCDRRQREGGPLILTVRPRGFSRTRAPTCGGCRAAYPRFAAPSNRTSRGSRRTAPVDRHADRDRGDAQRHRRAGNAIESLRLGGNHDERKYEAGTECQQGGFRVAHQLRSRDGATALSRTKKGLI